MNESTVQDIQKFEERSVTVQEPQSGSFIATVERLASNPTIDIRIIELLMNEREKDLNRSAKQEYNAAMVHAQNKMPSVLKNQYNEQTQSRYADLPAILRVITPVYTEEGFAISFHEGFPTADKPIKDNHIRMIADIMHEGGHTERMEADIPLDSAGIKGSVNKTGTHATGSSFSYGRRYMTCMIFNLGTGDDDDGNAAGAMETITLDQATEILDLLKEAKANVPAFLKWLKIDAVENIPARDYNKAITMLKAKKAAA